MGDLIGAGTQEAAARDRVGLPVVHGCESAWTFSVPLDIHGQAMILFAAPDTQYDAHFGIKNRYRHSHVDMITKATSSTAC